MAKGKYKARAANREVARDNELIVEKVEEIAALKQKLTDTERELARERTERGAIVLARANELSAEQIRMAREEISSMNIQRVEDQIRYAVLVWEIMHREKFGRPAPLHLDPDDEPESYDYWITLNWEICSLFCPDWESIGRAQLLCRGWTLQLAGSELGGRNGEPVLKQTRREATRQVRKGNIKGMMLGKVRDLRTYYDRVYAARQRGEIEPTLSFRDAHSNSQAPEDKRENLVNKMRETLGT